VVGVPCTGIVEVGSESGTPVVVTASVVGGNVVGDDAGIDVAVSTVVGVPAGSTVVDDVIAPSKAIVVGVGMVIGAGLVVGGSGAAGTVTVTITVTVGVGAGIVVGTLIADAGTCTMMTCGGTVVTGVVSGMVVETGRVVCVAASVVAAFTSVVAMISDFDFDDRPLVEMIAAAIVAQPMMIAPMMGASFVRW
jgi:hypothetical protein